MKDSLRFSLSALFLPMKQPLLLLFAMLLPLSGNPLEPFLWKNRIILTNSDEPLPQLRKESLEVAERDLVIIRLSASETALPNEIQASAEEREELRELYKITPESPVTFILIGKDGGEKARQTKSSTSKNSLNSSTPCRCANPRWRKQFRGPNRTARRMALR